MEKKPTDEQRLALDAFGTGENMVIEAGAGTGKTTTLRMMARGTNDKGVYIAYNKAIAEDAKANFPRNVQCATAHSFAFRSIGKNYSHRLNSPRQTSRQAAYILGINDGIKIGELAGEDVILGPNKLARLVLDMVTRFCFSADTQIEPKHMPKVNGVTDKAAHFELANYISKYANRAWVDLTKIDGKLKFMHDVYLKLWALSGPQLKVDFVLFDEAQDANPAIAGVALDQRDTQLIAVGDRCQAIYGWRGAEDAMEKWPAEHHLMLSQSFRFGPAVAMEANKWLQLLEAPLRLTGFDQINSVVDTLADPDAVLCRTNASTIAEAMKAREDEKKFAVVGGTREIESFAKAARDLQQGIGTEHPDLSAFKTWLQVKEYVAEDGGSDLKVFVNLIDTYGWATVMELAAEAVDEQYADIILSTAHKAKGREWDKVRISADFKAPEADPETGEQKLNRAEAMLAYVAVTRAKKVLDNEGLKWVEDFLPAPNVVDSTAVETTDNQPALSPALKQGIIAKGRRKRREGVA